jgi:hypothetical protein
MVRLEDIVTLVVIIVVNGNKKVSVGLVPKIQAPYALWVGNPKIRCKQFKKGLNIVTGTVGGVVKFVRVYFKDAALVGP